jgi:hypothetical protein
VLGWYRELFLTLLIAPSQSYLFLKTCDLIDF